MGIRTIGLISSLSIILVVSETLGAPSERCSNGQAKITSSSFARLACDIAQVAKQIRAQEDETIPAHIYHFGRKEHLIEDAEHNTVPVSAWNKFIMGNGSSFSLPSFRRGLYGCASPEDASQFFGLSSGEPWMMEIELAPDCRKPGSTASIFGLPNDARFKRWFQQLPENPYKRLEDFSMECYGTLDLNSISTQKEQLGKLWEGQGIRFTFAPGNETRCEKLINRFLDENNIRVVQDHLIKRSWYIRDHACIKGIKGRANDLLQIFLKEGDFWNYVCTNEHYPSTLFGLMTGIFVDDSTVVSAADSTRLRERIKTMNLPTDLGDSGFDLRVALNRTLDAYERCTGKSRRTEFKTLARQILDERGPKSLQDFSTKINGICREN